MLLPLLVFLPLSHIFQERFASCFIDNNFTHVQSNNILSFLQNIRTLLNTPRVKTIVSNVEPGEYIHFDLEASIIEVLSCFPIDSLPNQIDIDFNTDGYNLDRSGSVHIWPIQCRLANIKHIKPIIVGIYKGSAKPSNSNLFFKKFIADIEKNISQWRNNLQEKEIIYTHLSYHPCSKCIVCGIRCERRYIFPGSNHSLRTMRNMLEV
ncbi:hypothetical protein ACFW04_004630 [Cataglyphis niger]